MDSKKKGRMHKPLKVSAKNKVISKGTSYSDKYEIRRKMRLSIGSNKRTNSNKAVNKLGQKHANFNASAIPGMAMTKA